MNDFVVIFNVNCDSVILIICRLKSAHIIDDRFRSNDALTLVESILFFPRRPRRLLKLIVT